jgi:hypothetical protein
MMNLIEGGRVPEEGSSHNKRKTNRTSAMHMNRISVAPIKDSVASLMKTRELLAGLGVVNTGAAHKKTVRALEYSPTLRFGGNSGRNMSNQVEYSVDRKSRPLTHNDTKYRKSASLRAADKDTESSLLNGLRKSKTLNPKEVEINI